jgi:predicted ATPase/DNA-binding CsgD family transcriptional regulator/tetratricopeptide (TPR) repeat protein
VNKGGISSEYELADDLTWREHEVLGLLAEHLTNREIADRLHLAESTVKDYVGNILGKLYVKNRRKAVEKAKALGLLEGEAKTQETPRLSLPTAPTPFVGRREELSSVKNLLSETRLLSLTGPGGIGKTRLALKAAEDSASDFPDGCFFVSLAPIHSVKNIVQKIAEAMEFPLATQEDPEFQLLRYLKSKRVLLVMDNFEHLLEGAGLLNAILQAAPGVKILSTTREKLNLHGETNFAVGGLHQGDPLALEEIQKSDAVTLFLQSANRVCPGYAPAPDELKRIARICQLVEGMPLAIELAAAWLDLLSVDEIVRELEKGPDILAAELRDVPDRHRSIQSVFDHSWTLLEEGEKQIFMRLAVFRGGFMREAVQEVTGASLQQLAGLVNKSLLSHDPDTGRLTIHELLRQCAQERLEENAETLITAQETHAAYYAQFMSQRWEDLKGPRQMEALAEIEADIENIRTAWLYFLEHQNPQQLWRFIHGFWHVYWIRWWNHAGMELFSHAAEMLQPSYDPEITALGALAKAYQGYFMAWLDLADQGYTLAKEGVEVLEQFNHPRALAMAYDSLQLNAYLLSKYKEDSYATNRMVEIASDIGDKWLLALLMFGPGMGALINGDYDEAEEIAQKDLAMYEEIGDQIGLTMPLIVLGHASLAKGEYNQAREYYLRCLNISEKVGFYYSTQTASKYMVKVALGMGNPEEAEKYLLKSLAISKEIGFIRDIVNLLYEFARLKAAQDDPESAVELLGLVLQHPSSEHVRWREGRISDSANYLLAELKNVLSPEAIAAALQRGRNLQLDDVVTELFGSQTPLEH